MTARYFGQLFAQSWPGVLGAFFGALLAYDSNRRPPDIAKLRRLLGKRIKQFAKLGDEHLDAELRFAGEYTQRGCLGLLFPLYNAFCFSMGFVAIRALRLSHAASSSIYLASLACVLIAAVGWWLYRQWQRHLLLQVLRHRFFSDK